MHFFFYFIFYCCCCYAFLRRRYSSQHFQSSFDQEPFHRIVGGGGGGWLTSPRIHFAKPRLRSYLLLEPLPWTARFIASPQWAFRWISFTKVFLKDKGEGGLRLLWARARSGRGITRGTEAPEEAPGELRTKSSLHLPLHLSLVCPRRWACSSSGGSPPLQSPRADPLPLPVWDSIPALPWLSCCRKVVWLLGRAACQEAHGMAVWSQGLRPSLALVHMDRFQLYSPSLIPFRMLRINE